ncbi:hypothetical protein AB3G34_02325 [Flavobacterium sp. WC2409]|uniref:Uncharacterized protein n=1 Tax=Flavobacterium sp. WC2409 TaxID=3234139 RepID=A0AB39W5S0_9FLAO
MDNVIKINSKEELIEFVNRENVSNSDALKVAKQCFKIESSLNIPDSPNFEKLYTKADIIEKIQTSPPDLWILNLPNIGS